MSAGSKPWQIWLAATFALALVPCEAAACQAPVVAASAVVSIARTGEIVLADGRVLRLAGLDWPSQQRRSVRQRVWQALDRLTQGGTVTAATSGKADRWGRLPAQAFVRHVEGPPEPVWLQGTLLSLGYLQAWPEPGLGSCWPDMLNHEALARAAGRGHWSPLAGRQRRAALRRADPVAGTERVVFEGLVRSVREGRSVTFVNFQGLKARTPFFMVNKRELATYRKEGLDPATFSGKRLRVRGVLARGPTLRLELPGPQAIEILE